MNISTFFVVLSFVSSVAMTNNVYAMQQEADKSTQEEFKLEAILQRFKDKLRSYCPDLEKRESIKATMGAFIIKHECKLLCAMSIVIMYDHFWPRDMISVLYFGIFCTNMVEALTYPLDWDIIEKILLDQ